jgi:hypothetical protein
MWILFLFRSLRAMQPKTLRYHSTTMHSRLMRFFVFVMIAVLTGCSGGPKPCEKVTLLLPGPTAPTDPSDEALRAAMQSFINESGAPAFSLYDFERVDLNGDGRRDALALFKNPYGYWCGLYGCTMLVLKASDTDFKIVNAVQPVRGPLIVSDQSTNGWKNIIVRVSGRWTETKDVALTFDGNGYPVSPPELPAYLAYAGEKNTRIFMN